MGDVGAVAQNLREYGLKVSPKKMEGILVRTRRLGAAKRRPLQDDEFLLIAASEGATDI